MTQPYVLGFVGENAHGILRWWTEKILAGFAEHGYASRLIDLREENWQGTFHGCLAEGRPEFGFSFQGMGMGLHVNGENFWTRNGIPFLSYMGDSPYHAPALHVAEGPGMYLLYGCRDFLELYQRYVGGRACAGVLRYGFPENPLADRTPWKARKHALVFVKGAVDSEALRGKWAAMPAAVRSILEESSRRVLSGVDETVADVCAGVFAERQMYWGERRELFLFTCSQVDFHARAVRSEQMVKALMRHDALIVGDWGHLDWTGARARMQAPVPASSLEALYAESKILVSTSPSVRYGLHERVMGGLLAKAAVLSDSTPFLQRTFRECPAFLGVDMAVPDFVEQMGDVVTAFLADPASAEKVERSATVAREMFSMKAFTEELLGYLELEKHRRTLDWWTVTRPAGQMAQMASH